MNDPFDAIYVVAGVLGGASILLLIAVCVLAYLVNRLWIKVYPSEPEAKINYAYSKPEIETGEELNRRGYSIHRPPKTPPLDSRSGPRPSGLPTGGLPRDPYAYPANDRAISHNASNDFENIVFGGDPRAKRPEIPPPGMRNNRANQGNTSPHNDNILYDQRAYTPPPSARPDDRPFFNRNHNNY